MRLVLLVKKPDGLWEKTVFKSGSPCLDAPVMAVVLYDLPCFPKALCVVDALHGWDMAADDALRCLHHRLEGLAISSGAAAKPGSIAAREDALYGAPVKGSEGFCRNAKLHQKQR